jgi:hypothetical protein
MAYLTGVVVVWSDQPGRSHEFTIKCRELHNLQRCTIRHQTEAVGFVWNLDQVTVTCVTQTERRRP